MRPLTDVMLVARLLTLSLIPQINNLIRGGSQGRQALRHHMPVSSASSLRCEAFAKRSNARDSFIACGPTLVCPRICKCEVAKKRKGENREFDPAPPHYEFRIRQSLRQKPVDGSFLLETKLGQYAPVGIDDGRDSGIGGAYHRQALFDGAKLCLMKMLIGTEAGAEPRIVGDVEKPSWSLRTVDHLVGKNDLVANQRPRRRGAGDREQSGPGPSAEAAADAGELQEAEAFHEIPKREIFAERHEVDFVVAA